MKNIAIKDAVHDPILRKGVCSLMSVLAVLCMCIGMTGVADAKTQHAVSSGQWNEGSWWGKWDVDENRSYVEATSLTMNSYCFAIQNNRIKQEMKSPKGVQCKAEAEGGDDAQHDYVTFCQFKDVDWNNPHCS